YYELGNLFLTDYFDFRFYVNGEERGSVRIGTVKNGELISEEKSFEQLASLFKEFAQQKTSTVSSSKQLAEMMAGKARLMRDVIYNSLVDQEQQESTLHEQLKAFREILIHDMSEKEFADVYAQTIT